MAIFIPTGCVLFRLPLSDLLQQTRYVTWYGVPDWLPSLRRWYREANSSPRSEAELHWLRTPTADLTSVLSSEEAAVTVELRMDKDADIYVSLTEEPDRSVGFIAFDDAGQIFQDWHALHPGGSEAPEPSA